MKALWIAATFCLASTSILAQPANKTVVDLDTCIKLARVTEANCSTPAYDAAQRQECIQNALKTQIECLERAAAPVDRPPAAAAAAPPDRPAEVAASPEKPAEVAAPVAVTGAVPSPGAIPSPGASSSPEATPPANPIAGASAGRSESKPASTAAAAPSDKPVAATPPSLATVSNPAPAVAQGNWTVSEMSSPVDYSPVVTAALRARSENRIKPAALVVRCHGGRSELGLRMEGIPRPSRGNEILVAQQINDQPTVKSRWTASADGRPRVTTAMRPRCCNRFPRIRG